MIRWIPDQDDARGVDDLFAQGVDVRMERMSDGRYWLCIYDGSEEHHFDLAVPARSRTKIRAFAREPDRLAVAHTPVDNHNLWLLVLHEMRYAMGRKTSAPSTSADHVRQFWNAFSQPGREQLLREVHQALDIQDTFGRGLGDACDVQTWRELAAWMEAHRG